MILGIFINQNDMHRLVNGEWPCFLKDYYDQLDDNILCFFFVYNDVSLSTQTVHGYYWSSQQQWIQRLFPIPDIIYVHSDDQETLASAKLLQETFATNHLNVRVTSYPLPPDLLEIFEYLAEDVFIKNYIPKHIPDNPMTFLGNPFTLHYRLREDQNGTWKTTVAIAKVLSYSTSQSANPCRMLHADIVLQTLFPCKADSLTLQYSTLCKRICEKLKEKYPQNDKIAIDMRTDTQGKPWITSIKLDIKKNDTPIGNDLLLPKLSALSDYGSQLPAMNCFSLGLIHRKSNKKTLFLNPIQMQLLKYTCGQTITLQIGMKRVQVKIAEQNLKHSPSVLYVNKLAATSLPYIMGCQLNIVYHSPNTLILGSTFGYNVSKKTWTNFKRVATIRKRAQLAMKKGVLFSCFCIDNVDWKNNVVDSYCLNPFTHKWEKRKLPVPQVFYYRGDKVRTCNYQSKGKVRDIHWINAKRMFGKWETHIALQYFKNLATHLPETTLLSLPALKQYTDNYPACFVKNSIGSCGRNVFRIEKKSPNQYICSSGGSMVKQLNFSSLENLFCFLNKTMRKSCIIQQGIPLATIDGCPFDMRILIQKNIDGKWELSALNFRIANPGAVVTNFSAGARDITTVPGDPLPHPKLTWSNLHSFSLMIAYALETSLGALGEIGLDAGVDDQGNLWVIEANSRPNTIAYRNATSEALETILGNPLDYSIFLNRLYHIERSP